MDERYRALQTVQEECMCISTALEDEKHAGFKGNGYDAESFFEVLRNLLLLVVPLKRVARREHPVTVRQHFSRVRSRADEHGDAQAALGQVESLP